MISKNFIKEKLLNIDFLLYYVDVAVLEKAYSNSVKIFNKNK